MTKVVEIRDLKKLEDIIKNSRAVVVDYAAESWCRPCMAFKPHFDLASENTPRITFIHVDVDESPEIAEAHGIMSVPTVMKFKNGEYVGPLEARTAVKIVTELADF